MFVCQKFVTKNDPSGNPRRLWVVSQILGDHTEDRYIYVEGYTGNPPEVKGIPALRTVEVPPSVWRDIIRGGKASGLSVVVR
jgi:hypothetical protein